MYTYLGQILGDGKFYIKRYPVIICESLIACSLKMFTEFMSSRAISHLVFESYGSTKVYFVNHSLFLSHYAEGE